MVVVVVAVVMPAVVMPSVPVTASSMIVAVTVAGIELGLDMRWNLFRRRLRRWLLCRHQRLEHLGELIRVGLGREPQVTKAFGPASGGLGHAHGTRGVGEDGGEVEVEVAEASGERGVAQPGIGATHRLCRGVGPDMTCG